MDTRLERDIVWVTAPSGAGKTIVANQIAKLVNGEILTDAAEMIALNKLDTNHEYHFHPYQDEQFVLSSSHHFDQVAIRLADTLRSAMPSGITVVELARGVGNNHNVDASYKRLLSLIPEEIFARSAFLYVKTVHAQRMARNAPRRTNNFSDNLPASSFRVPLEAMEGFYRGDDFDEVRPAFPCPTYIIDNGDIPITELWLRLRETAREMEIY